MKRLLFALLALASPAAAKVIEVTPTGFTGEHALKIAAPPERVWATLIAINRWWSKDHSYSGDAANFTLDPRAGGCWCEKLPGGGSVEHQRVIFVQPGKLLRLSGALGPMQAFAVNGVISYELRPEGAGTVITVTSRTGGVFPGGFIRIATMADDVLAEQVARLKAVAEER